MATLLVQAPLLELDTGFGTYLIRSWDVVWAGLGGLTLWWLIGWRPHLAELRGTVSAAFVLMAMWVAVSVLSLAVTWATFGSSAFADSVVRGIRFAGILLVAWVVSQVATGRRSEHLVLAILAVSVVAAAAAAGVWITQEKRVGSEVLGITRAGGPFGNFFADGLPKEWWAGSAGPNNLGLWLATATATLALAAARIANAFRSRALGSAMVLAGLAVLAVGLVATHSRESWVAAAVATATLAALRPGVPGRWRFIGLIAVVGLAVGLFAAIPSVSGRIADTFTPGTFSYETGPQARLAAWDQGLEWAWERFPIGWGLGSMEEHPADFGRASAENVFLQSFVGAGILGFLLLISATVAALVAALRGYLANPETLGAVLPAAFFTAFVVHGLFGNSLSDPTIEVLFGCALGLVLVCAPLHRQPASEPT